MISDEDLKKQGVSVIEDALTQHSTALISVGGEKRYVVMSLELFEYLRECELEATLLEMKEDLANDRHSASSAEGAGETVKYGPDSELHCRHRPPHRR